MTMMGMRIMGYRMIAMMTMMMTMMMMLMMSMTLMRFKTMFLYLFPFFSIKRCIPALFMRKRCSTSCAKRLDAYDVAIHLLRDILQSSKSGLWANSISSTEKYGSEPAPTNSIPCSSRSLVSDYTPRSMISDSIPSPTGKKSVCLNLPYKKQPSLDLNLDTAT